MFATTLLTALLAPTLVVGCGNGLFKRKSSPPYPSAQSDIYYFERGYYGTAIRHALWNRQHLIKASPKYKKIIQQSTKKHTTDLIGLKILAASTIRTKGQFDLHTYLYKTYGRDRLKPSQRIWWATKVLIEFQRTYPTNPEIQSYLAEAYALKKKTKKKAYTQLQALAQKDLLPDADAHLTLARLHSHFGNKDGAQTHLKHCKTKTKKPEHCTLGHSFRHYIYRRDLHKNLHNNRNIALF